MNYLAHLYLAKPDADSLTGNLLGDFCRSVDTLQYSTKVRAGLENHRLVDRFTDHHPNVRAAKQRFSRTRRRFAGIALDVLFDYFLIQHWDRFADEPFEAFCARAYQRLASRLPIMPPRMQQVVGSMIQSHWLAHYQSLDGVAHALDRIAGRIRFSNQFAGSIVEIRANLGEFEHCFEQFFPALVTHVDRHGPE